GSPPPSASAASATTIIATSGHGQRRPPPRPVARDPLPCAPDSAPTRRRSPPRLRCGLTAYRSLRDPCTPLQQRAMPRATGALAGGVDFAPRPAHRRDDRYRPAEFAP